MANATNAFSLDMLKAMQAKMNALTDDLYTSAIFGKSLFRDITAKPATVERNPIFGFQVRESGMFPYVQACHECNGTGEGKASTYCPKCKGAGATKIEGVATGARDSMVVITSPLPRKFEPSAGSISVTPSERYAARVARH